ncbi:hypothetical protein ACT4R0_03240 [Ornithobacterium rhinotracheale]|uniref:hypothetical protein n=1 Tax=Ornithobacterium rhinotracheale TaxID=28251 RepID=UPI00129C679D|nr:hypothetical protein [Ornithobacterium rhinotracheale]MRJ09068.1 hypothetical protein [Ornithobacterium rhinotracheale]UOH77839.1 hypothetical protein MT996_11645 [Ornithobacterium rhinotracheale]
MGAFKDLQVFEEPKINQLMDELFSFYGYENLFICGSIARYLDGDKTIVPKDIDLVPGSEYDFKRISNTIRALFPEANVVEIDSRIMLRFAGKLVEIWKPKFNFNERFGFYKQRIPYIISKKIK